MTQDWELCKKLAEGCVMLDGHDGPCAATVEEACTRHRRFDGPHTGCTIATPHIHQLPAELGPSEATYEAVDHPAHYNTGSIEHIAYVEDRGWTEGYCLGNATKYIHRAGQKPGSEALQDLKKAAWYLNRYISWLERGKA